MRALVVLVVVLVVLVVLVVALGLPARGLGPGGAVPGQPRSPAQRRRQAPQSARAYSIPIAGTPRTVRLAPCTLPHAPGLERGGTTPQTRLYSFQRDCFYEGYVEGFPVSLVALSTCSGLSGVLQLANTSYGIRPLEAAAGYQHLVYQILLWFVLGLYFLKGKEAVHRSPRYLEMHVVLDKQLGSGPAVVSVCFQMFSRLNLTIALSSLELWTEKNKIPTMGDAEELLQRFLQWKNIHRVLRLQDITFLFVSPLPVGASSAKKLCLKNHAGGVALVRSLSAFSVVVAQLLGLSLGMVYDDPRSCHCAGATCIMQPSAGVRHSAGTKAFSSCKGQCLLNRPTMDVSYKAPVCGNKVVEPGEACDCGSAEECRRDLCCTVGCKRRKGVQCLSGPCCWKCKFAKSSTLCRTSSEDECELKEYCNGTSGECTANQWVMDGHPCSRNTAFCYRGACQTADKQCQDIFGKGAKNGPLACYEEINGQRDRMGHCGSNHSGYQSCAWKDLQCGKLICEYPGNVPFTKEKAAVIYTRVQNTLCITLDYMRPPTERDPMLVKDGTVCGDHKVTKSFLSLSVAQVCNNKGTCHCHAGWKPPNCQEKAGKQGGSKDSPLSAGEQRGQRPHWAAGKGEKK
uniref:Disintegrin and metalloproteinase domain-containing protein 21 n=1 Tax=Anas platyrhynchos TaxID=8839 RepID=A0A8B9T4L2_ANAPL